ncbi:unnamed protein product, partial [Prunus brigantina]
VEVSSLFWLGVINHWFCSVWPGQNFLPVSFLFLQTWIIPPVCPQPVSIIVGKKVDPGECAEVLAGSAASELVQGLLAELGPHAPERERLLPSVQPEFLHALVFQQSVQ